MANEVKIEISVEERDALRALTKLTQKTEETEEKVKKNFQGMSSAFDVFKGNLAANAVSKGFNLVADASKKLFNVFITDGVRAAQVQEDAINKLNAQLALTGDLSQETSNELQEFASELQQVTKFGDEAILSQLAFAQAMGASVDQSKEIVAAATDMSESLGIDLNSAVRNISKTLGGYAGELGEVIPELKNLSKEQLQAGEGIDLLAAKFEGAATAATKTFSGAVAQASNTFGDLTEEVGFLITQNPVVISTINGLNKAFNFLANEVKQNQGAIIDFINGGVNFLISGIKPAGEAIITFNNIIEGSKNFIGFLADLLLGTGQSFLEFGKTVLDTVNAVGRFVNIDTSGIEGFSDSLEKQIETVKMARKANEEEVASRIASQQEFADKMREITGTVVNLIETEIEATEASTAATVKSNNKKVESTQQTFDLMRAMKEEEKLLAEEERLLAEVTAQENNEKALENLRANQQAQQELKQQFSEQDKALSQKIRKQREEDSKAAAEAQKNSLASLFSYEKNVSKDRAANFKSTLGTIASLQQSSNKELFAVGKAAAIGTATIDGIAAVQKALGSAPPPFNFALATLVGVATAANVAKIASQKPPSFQEGGFTGFVDSSSRVGDTNLIRTNGDEFVANRGMQRNLLSNLANNPATGDSNLGEAINNLTSTLASQPIVVMVDSKEIARATREGMREGLAIA